MSLDDLHDPYISDDGAYEDKDFIGFTFNGRHSSEFHIVRIIEGSRLSDTLVPNVKDITMNVPGRDGTYFFGQTVEGRTFSISYAFDNLTEDSLLELTQWLSDKQIHELVFDETPYKTYMAKVTGTAQMKSLCFDDMNSAAQTIRVYRGEGSIEFTAYCPYAQCKKKYQNDYRDKQGKLPPICREWVSAAGIKVKMNNDDIFIPSQTVSEGQSVFTMQAYNRGDIAETPLTFIMTLHSTDGGIVNIPAFTLTLASANQYASLSVEAMTTEQLVPGAQTFELEYDSYHNLWGLYLQDTANGTRTLKSRLWGLSVTGEQLLMPLGENIQFTLTIDQSDYDIETNPISIQYAYWYY